MGVIVHDHLIIQSYNNLKIIHSDAQDYFGEVSEIFQKNNDLSVFYIPTTGGKLGWFPQSIHHQRQIDFLTDLRSDMHDAILVRFGECEPVMAIGIPEVLRVLNEGYDII